MMKRVALSLMLISFGMQVQASLPSTVAFLALACGVRYKQEKTTKEMEFSYCKVPKDSAFMDVWDKEAQEKGLADVVGHQLKDNKGDQLIVYLPAQGDQVVVCETSLRNDVKRFVAYKDKSKKSSAEDLKKLEQKNNEK